MAEILGIKIDDLTRDEVLEKVEEFLDGDKQRYIVLPNSEVVVRANRDRYLREIINNSDLSLSDGRGLFFATKILGQPIKEQIPGVELIEELSKRHPKIFLFGGRKDIVQKAAGNLGPNIIDFIDGYQETDRVIERINQIQPRILFVGLGVPKQEKWIADNLIKLPSVRLAIGVGGAFDFISGRIKRAPKALRKAGLEWSWRFLLEPWRAKRIFKAVIVFPWLVIHNRAIYFSEKIRYNSKKGL